MARQLPPHPNLKHLKNQAKALLQAHKAGDGEAGGRIKANLPRLSRVPDSEIAVADISLQETQHVIAREYGFSGWTRLKNAATFENFVNLRDREIQAVMKRITRDTIQVALWAGSEEVKEKFLGNMTDRLRTFVEEELEFKGPLAPWCLPEADLETPPLDSLDGLLELTDREIQIALREIDQTEVAIVLGQASPEVKEKLLTNVSEPVRAFIETQLAASEKVPSKEIAKVQREFLETTKAAIEKATEEVRENIEAAREQIIQIYQSER